MKKADNFDAKKWLVENKVTFQSRLNENEDLAAKIAALPNHHTAEDTDKATLIVGKYAVVHYDESDEGGEDMYVVWDNTVDQDEIGSYDDVPEFESEDPAEVADWLEQNASRLNEAIGIGPMGATSQKRFTAASGEEGSSSPDEFSLSVVTNPLTGRKTNFNYKLKNVEFEKKKVQELFGNLFKSSPKIKFTFERTGEAKDKKATMEIKLKDDKFVLANSSTTEDITGSIPDDGEAKKFIDYLLNKSQWGKDLKQTFENIEQALTPASFK